jgi:hypothetical protein
MTNKQLIPWDAWQKYRLIARPEAGAAAELALVADSFRTKAGGEGQYPEPVLCFFEQRLPEASEQLLLKWLQNLCSHQPAFEVQVINVGGLPPHLVYARLQPTEGLQAFTQKLHSLLKDLAGVTDSPRQLLQQVRLPLITELPTPLFHLAMGHFSPMDVRLQLPVTLLELQVWQADGSWKRLQMLPLVQQPQPVYEPWYQIH